MNCRYCATPLEHVFADLGTSPPSNSYLNATQLDGTEEFYPLKVFVCGKCFLVQVDEFKKAEDIFSDNYAYFSSFSKSWLEHARKYVEEMSDRFGLDTSSQVIEIASNDGYLLQYFKEREVPVLGIEPTLSTATVARGKGIETETEFFGTRFAQSLVERGIRADLLLGNNVLAHVPDITDFVAGLAIALKPDGVVTMEFPHIMRLVANNQFDTIYHEHFSYLSLYTVKEIFESQGLTLFDVEELPTHGGSLRIFAKHAKDRSHAVSGKIAALLEAEADAGLRRLDYYLGFQPQVERAKDELLAFVASAKSEGKKIAAYGAAAKGNTLLNYCGIGSDHIEFVVDASPHKQGLYLPGSHIPIVAEDRIKREKPDYVLILPWNIKAEIVEQITYIREWGGKFVVAIPALEIS